MAIEKTFQDHYESLFNLKNQPAKLLPTSRKKRQLTLSVKALEQWRINAKPVPSSKYGLEAICGASGEIAMN